MKNYICIKYKSDCEYYFPDYKSPQQRFIKSNSKLLIIIKLLDYYRNYHYHFRFSKSKFSKKDCITYMIMTNCIEDSSELIEKDDIKYIKKYGFVDNNNFSELYYNKNLNEFVRKMLEYSKPELNDISRRAYMLTNMAVNLNFGFKNLNDIYELGKLPEKIEAKFKEEIKMEIYREIERKMEREIERKAKIEGIYDI